jgi:hypothetical protein
MASLCEKLIRARWITESKITDSKLEVQWTVEGLNKAHKLANLINEICPGGVASELDLECMCLSTLVESSGRAVGPQPPSPSDQDD